TRSNVAAMESELLSRGKIMLSAGPGLTRPAMPSSFSRLMMPRAISASGSITPSFGFPVDPYHSPISYKVPRGTIGAPPPPVPSLSANHPTLNGLALPQSNARSIRHDDGISNGLTTCTLWSHRSSNIPPLVISHDPSSHALRLLG